MLAGLGALVVLAVVFGSLVALTPLLIAAVAIPSAFTLVYALTYLTTMSFLVQNILALVGLGVAIDYALLIVTRWREERGNGRRQPRGRADAHRPPPAVRSCSPASPSPSAWPRWRSPRCPFLRSIGLAGMLIPLISVVVSATLLPVILDALGPRLEWPRRRPARTVSPLWTRIARGVVARPAWAAAGALVVLGRPHRAGRGAQPRRAAGRRHRRDRARRRPSGP